MRLLDLFSGAGGAAMGYALAGFDHITGIDIAPMPRYPFDFIQADALEWLRSNAADVADSYDLIHASPPCQRYSHATAVRGREHWESRPDLVEPTRLLLDEIGLPYVIENVPGAPLLGGILLCGTMFGLEVWRHRIFEGDVPILAPFSCHHDGPPVGVYGHTGAGANRGLERKRGRSNSKTDWARAMGIPEEAMTAHELAEAIPPAYTQWLGEQWLMTNG